MIELSIEDIYNFIECPVKYLLNKEGKVTREISPKKEDQIIFEGAMFRFYADKIDNYDQTVEDVKENISQIIFNMEGYNLLDTSRQRRIREKKAIKLAETFAKHEVNVDQEVLAIEHPFVLKLGEQFLIKDKIPLIRKVDGQIEVVIFRLSNKKASPFYLDTDLAITIYDMAFRKEFDRRPDRIAVYHIPSSSIYHTDRSSWQYKRALKTIKHIEESILKEDYHTRESFMCDSCNARYSCLDYYK